MGDRPRVHVTFPPPGRVPDEIRALPWHATLAERPDTPREQVLRDIAGCDAVIARLTDRVDAELLDAAGPQLKVVANFAVGFDNVDLEAARARGVRITNTPGTLDGATADLTMALVLATARRVVEGDRFIRAGRRWEWSPTFFAGLDLSAGATLGIVGLGRIGLAVARRALAFDMRVIATPTRSHATEAAELGIELMPLDDLLRASDVVSLHCPLNADTRHLISARELALIGPDSILVNTARGPVVDEAALVEALRDGILGAAGLDVFEHEPSVSPGLLDLENVVLVPHIGSAAGATREAMARMAVANVIAVLDGREPPAPVV
ncbi:MAG TPA: D-glycerate dehydrogenase [Nocardioides sp.]|nr:D-glycerate dehydrogenase [Nocardioides sp.]